MICPLGHAGWAYLPILYPGAVFPSGSPASHSARFLSHASLWGLVRPAGGVTTADILVADQHKTFHKLRTVTTDAGGYWQFTTSYRSGRRFRVEWTAPDGTVFRGPPIRAYP